MKTALMIVNPVSGTGADKEEIVALARQMLPPAGWSLQVERTTRRGHAGELAAAAVARDADAVIAVGGDGTVNEAARSLAGTNTALAIVPCGSGNGLARHLGVSMNPEQALHLVADRLTEPCDCCTANGQKFFCTFGLGFDAAVSDRFASRPDRRGLSNYLRSAIEEFVRYKADSYIISADAETLTERALLIACCNASQYGNNAFIAPAASVSDGLMDVTVIHSGSWLAHALSGIELLTGTLHDSPRVHTFQTRSVRIRRPAPGPVHLDGEPLSMDSDISVECHHHALRVFSPGEVKVKPLLTPLGL